MEVPKVLMKYYQNNQWNCGESYESIEWKDATTPKPTKEHLESLWNELIKNEMREERNKLLSDSDFRVLPDYSNVNKEDWITYRQKLRDFPATWSEGMTFPEKPL
jgi:hypothetical protein